MEAWVLQKKIISKCVGVSDKFEKLSLLKYFCQASLISGGRTVSRYAGYGYFLWYFKILTMMVKRYFFNRDTVTQGKLRRYLGKKSSGLGNFRR